MPIGVTPQEAALRETREDNKKKKKNTINGFEHVCPNWHAPALTNELFSSQNLNS